MIKALENQGVHGQYVKIINKMYMGDSTKMSIFQYFFFELFRTNFENFLEWNYSYTP